MKNVKEIELQYNEVADKWRMRYRLRGITGALSGWKFLMRPNTHVKTSQHQLGIFTETHHEIALFDTRDEAEIAIMRWVAPPTEYLEMEEGDWENVAVYHPRRRID
jgi:hypothetical protein